MSDLLGNILYNLAHDFYVIGDELEDFSLQLSHTQEIYLSIYFQFRFAPFRFR